MTTKKTKKNFKRDKRDQEFEQKIVDLARVTRVMAGGKRMKFRATIVIGDKKGRVGIGTGKGADVTVAISKAANVAQKNIIQTPIVNGTIPCEIKKKFGAAVIYLRSAKPGTGVIAGSSVRTVLELSGLQDVVGKIYGSKNKINNVKATINALKDLEKMVDRRKKQNAKKEDNAKKIAGAKKVVAAKKDKVNDEVRQGESPSDERVSPGGEGDLGQDKKKEAKKETK
jgi:small subunit ribosomal protein S5